MRVSQGKRYERLMIVLRIAVLAVLVIALVHGPCPEAGRVDSACPVCHAVRGELHSDESVTLEDTGAGAPALACLPGYQARPATVHGVWQQRAPPGICRIGEAFCAFAGRAI